MHPSSRTAPRPAGPSTPSCRSSDLPAGRSERRLPSFVSVLVVGCALLAAAACGDGGPRGVVVGPTGEGAGGDGVRIEVDAAGDTVTYDWEGGAGHLLQVRNLDEGSTVWRIVAVDRSDEGGFAPPVRHGIAPSGAEEEVAPGVLVQGDAHRVTVERADGTRGTREFRP